MYYLVLFYHVTKGVGDLFLPPPCPLSLITYFRGTWAIQSHPQIFVYKGEFH